MCSVPWRILTWGVFQNLAWLLMVAFVGWDRSLVRVSWNLLYGFWFFLLWFLKAVKDSIKNRNHRLLYDPQRQLKVHARGYVKIFEVVVKKDLAVFEERRLQDLLLSRVDAPKLSVNMEDFHFLWNQRLIELLEKRQLYQQVTSAPPCFKARLHPSISSHLER